LGSFFYKKKTEVLQDENSNHEFYTILFFLFVIVSPCFFHLNLQSQTIPAPESVLGFKVGEDYHLADYKQILNYFRELAAASDRVRLFTIGKTSMGQDMIYAVISSEENIQDLEKYKGDRSTVGISKRAIR